MRAQNQGNRRLRDGGRVAFTLIELLVVIAIIALLIAILLPSLEAARRQSKQSACLSHIKNIATSSRVYEADDPNGWGIPVHPCSIGSAPASGKGKSAATRSSSARMSGVARVGSGGIVL